VTSKFCSDVSCSTRTLNLREIDMRKADDVKTDLIIIVTTGVFGPQSFRQ
jgi:hypothetical protein